MEPFDPIVCVVGFHHARGPEVESWYGVPPSSDPAHENEWPLLPFMALSDGAHASTEDFSYFTLRREATDVFKATSLFGISCTRQLDSTLLIDRPADVTRSTVQKAVVVIGGRESVAAFGQVKEKLSVVTKAWFDQRDFTDVDILQRFQESLAKTFRDQAEEKDHYFGLSLREFIHKFKYQTLVLFKCALLQPKMLFFGSHCEEVCMVQFALISLIPRLIRHLQDCADPTFNSYEDDFVRPTSLKTSDRASLLAYMGLPLQIFGKGALFGPYTPLQQLDMLADYGTKSYIVGSTNSLLLQQKDRYSDILINLDENTINIMSASLRQALVLSVPDRRWIDFLTQTVNDTWDPANPTRPKTLGYAGSEEFIRLQFEEYLLAMLSAAKLHSYLATHGPTNTIVNADIDGDPSSEFGSDFFTAWKRTENYRLFDRFTDSHLFDIVEPKHPCSGGLSIDDVQRRLAAQVADLHLDERFGAGREFASKQLAAGQKKVSTAFNSIWAEMEAVREAQRRRAEEVKAERDAAIARGERPPETAGGVRRPDFAQAQASVQAAGTRAGAYLSSWGAWASEKRKTGWGARTASAGVPRGVTEIVEKRSSSVPQAAVAVDVKMKPVEEVKTPATVGPGTEGIEESMEGGENEGLKSVVSAPPQLEQA
ncbi:hypothetical protein EJ05DRAFT_436352 [Pseudovirgaria hyperparasitica]|uniref:UDENN domain-containing protein n=1 Tax=Pseudovirgaria hyperparasitica TaxID=470096 RepID=A0A6A6WF36_9PEZI|nr:uncharacterized protein EJ05DRAFT_436352 [Pseudovirgaria hyperparasitica]KAF2760644.1 hypothetical protein EJ05DRAFT_436352 [Pseudovirgaria hyperparasitica]